MSELTIHPVTQTTMKKHHQWKLSKHCDCDWNPRLIVKVAERKLADLGMFGNLFGLHLGCTDGDWNHLLLQQGSEAWHNGINHLQHKHKLWASMA